MLRINVKLNIRYAERWVYIRYVMLLTRATSAPRARVKWNRAARPRSVCAFNQVRARQVALLPVDFCTMSKDERKMLHPSSLTPEKRGDPCGQKLVSLYRNQQRQKRYINHGE